MIQETFDLSLTEMKVNQDVIGDKIQSLGTLVFKNQWI